VSAVSAASAKARVGLAFDSPKASSATPTSVGSSSSFCADVAEPMLVEK
jgi:hypothetical protein